MGEIPPKFSRPSFSLPGRHRARKSRLTRRQPQDHVPVALAGAAHGRQPINDVARSSVDEQPPSGRPWAL